METNSEHINNLFKQKFEDFTPQPPERVWAGIASALDKGVVPWYSTLPAKIVAIVIGAAILLGGYWLLSLQNTQPDKKPTMEAVYQNTTESNVAIDTKTDKTIQQQQRTQKQNENSYTATHKADQNHIVKHTASSGLISASGNNGTHHNEATAAKPKILSSQQPGNATISEQNLLASVSNTGEPFAGFSTIQAIPKKTVSLNNNLSFSILKPGKVENNKQFVTHKKQSGNWILGLYFSPEFIFDPFDSLTIQNSYAIKVEPTYYFNNHWFIRPGIGLSYARDKGFVKADYMSWDYLGSYEDVVDVTFDTVGNTVTPVYHTQTRDVYDSILHVTISEETNRYLYLQTSLVFGYHNHVNKFGWSIYAGPQVNFILTEKRDNPLQDNQSAVYLKYNLANRHSPQYGLKIGFGLDYAIAKRWLLSVEPEYNYFINGINGGDVYNTPLSGIGLRFGLIYTLK